MPEISTSRTETRDSPALRCVILQAVHSYWLEKRGDRFAPSRSDIKPEEIVRLLPYVLLMDVVGAPLRFRYRLVGTAFATEYGQEITGKFVDEIDLADKASSVIADCAEVVRSRAPSFNNWEYTKADGRHVEVERVLLPLSNDGETVNMLFGAITARGFSALTPSSDLIESLRGTGDAKR